jgi:hypothetical protein
LTFLIEGNGKRERERESDQKRNPRRMPEKDADSTPWRSVVMVGKGKWSEYMRKEGKGWSKIKEDGNEEVGVRRKRRKGHKGREKKGRS